MVSSDVLTREIYTTAQAAGLLRVPLSTLTWWLEGGERRGKRYEPVLRVAPTGAKMLTWGEFVEAGFLREYRRGHGVSLGHLRQFITILRSKVGVLYPLAYYKPFIGEGAQLVLDAQKESSLDPELWLFLPASGQQLLPSAATVQFLDKVEFAGEGDQWAQRVHPQGKASPVVFDPSHSFGEPTVRGIRTDVLSELVEAGEPVDTVARDYRLQVAEVKAAVGYEFAMAA